MRKISLKVKHIHFTGKKFKKWPKSGLGVYLFLVVYALIDIAVDDWELSKIGFCKCLILSDFYKIVI